MSDQSELCAECLVSSRIGDSLLKAVWYRGHEKCVELLVQSGADVKYLKGWAGLRRAVKKTHTTCILIKGGAYVNHENSDGCTALMYAAVGGHDKCVELLIKEGANVNHQDMNALTVLMWTAGEGQVKCMELLIQTGADVKVVDKNGWTALMYAALERTPASAWSC